MTGYLIGSSLQRNIHENWRDLVSSLPPLRLVLILLRLGRRDWGITPHRAKPYNELSWGNAPIDIITLHGGPFTSTSL